MQYYMAYRRRRTTRRRTRRPMTKRRTRKRTNTKIFRMKRHAAITDLTITSGTGVFQGYTFELSQVPGFTDMLNLFDSFKITGIKVMFYPEMTQSISTGNINSPTYNQLLFSVIDYTDSIASSSIDELREYSTCKATSIYRPHIRYFKPKVMDYGNVYNPPGNPWLSCDTGKNYNYHGLKMASQPTTMAAVGDYVFKAEAIFYLAFKSIR